MILKLYVFAYDVYKLYGLLLTRTWLEDKLPNFGRVDHLWPHKAGDCD